ncbi:predicted protein [Naegleria gruberi]|uniref:Predicted protein n=1 Tax=Naegleria gruberi TaxID=5762 RepID=D2VRY7_NAEGR|nr:uncharacterized protein NAEGRDRAFT_71750 [Naegleria gruberi]EFC40546.1 predicted protein [Naegleria gruberi]|eukprot:XP_002673290.1 predicted protein [Naegleria gruberi strain NEG-M]
MSILTWFRKQFLLLLMSRFSIPRDVFRFAYKRYANDKYALISPSIKPLTYSELKERMLTLLTVLTNKASLRKGDYLFTLLPEGSEYILAMLACFESGIILVNIPRNAGKELLLHVMDKVEIREDRNYCFLYDRRAGEESSQLLKEIVPQISLLSFDVIDEEFNNIVTNSKKSKSDFYQYSSNVINPDDWYSLGFTSGTTSVPKCLSANHGLFILSLTLTIRNVELGPVSFSSPPIDKSKLDPSIDPEKINEVSLVGIPTNGAGSGMVIPTLISGGALLIPSEFTAEEFLKLIPKYKVTRLFTTPSLLIDLLDSPNIDKVDLSSLTNIIYGTELMPVGKLEEALARFGPILQQGYGSAEVLPPVSMLSTTNHLLESNTIDENGKYRWAPRSVLSSVGIVVPQVQVVIADDDDKVLEWTDKSKPPPIGNILVKSPTQFKGYIKNQEMTEKTLKGGWLHIGDVGYLREGRLYVLGRRADVIERRINSSASSISTNNNHDDNDDTTKTTSSTTHTTYPRLVEEIIHDHPAIKETAYVQVSEEKAVMAISLRHGRKADIVNDEEKKKALCEELMLFLTEKKVPQEDLPNSIHIFDGDLPRSQLAKVLKREVRVYLQQSSSVTK